MKSKKWYAGDIHEHSIYSSSVFGGDDNAPDSLEEIYKYMRSNGLSFGALSDHHNILNHKDWEKFETPDFVPIISKEISTAHGHVMALNASEDVIFNPMDQDDESLRKEFIRVCREIRRTGGIAQIHLIKQ